MISLSTTRALCDSFEKSKKLGRPMSPHLTIYQPQLTWYMSALHRITGAGIATGFYGLAAWYALSPFHSADLVSAMHSLPSPILFGFKALVAFPLAYHTMNGIRHLVTI
jgi:succinate dehydrogenase (ubiquinone) cytochrome b560 subunit